MAWQTTTWADGQTVHGTDINVITTAVNTLGAGNAATKAAVTSASSTAQTQLVSYTIPASYAVAGSTYKMKVFGTTGTASGTLTYQIHIGTANTTADVVVATAAPAVAASAGTMFEGLLTVRTTGAAGTCMASGIGMGSTTAYTTATVTQTVNTTVQNFLTVTVAASAGTHVIQTGFASVAQA
jgi:hypothetical protein